MTPLLRVLLRFALGIWILTITGFAAHSQNPPGVSLSAELLGTWHLKTVGDKDPGTIAIKSWQVEFREQGKWIYSGTMTGKWEGMTMSGSGIWVLHGSQMEYTAGANAGITTVHVDKDLLVVSPDPVIRLNGKQAIDTQYVRVGPR